MFAKAFVQLKFLTMGYDCSSVSAAKKLTVPLVMRAELVRLNKPSIKCLEHILILAQLIHELLVEQCCSTVVSANSPWSRLQGAGQRGSKRHFFLELTFAEGVATLAACCAVGRNTTVW